MTMLRRWEIYALAPDAPPEKITEMERCLLEAQRYLPEVLHSAIGHNRSSAGYDVAWEHAYESAESYQRYMVRPYHSNIIDRYLLNDSPERVVADSDLDAGLVGYACDGPVFYLPAGHARRLVLLRLRPGSAVAFAEVVAQAEAANPQMILSVFAENTFATRWMDGMNQIYKQTTFSHIWEQGYRGLDDASLGPAGWTERGGDMIEQTLELWYTIKPGYGYGALE
jgi:hypothetical protein